MRETYQNGARLEQTEEDCWQEVFLCSTDNSKLSVSILLEVAVLTTCKLNAKENTSAIGVSRKVVRDCTRVGINNGLHETRLGTCCAN